MIFFNDRQPLCRRIMELLRGKRKNYSEAGKPAKRAHVVQGTKFVFIGSILGQRGVKLGVWEHGVTDHPRPAPTALDERSSLAGLRTIATFEAIKGIAVILLMLALLAVHSHVDDLAEGLLFHLHMDPDRRASQAFLNAAYRLGDMRLLTIAGAAISYSSVRFVESWGLWHRRVWAEWFALLSGCLYLPWEIIKLIEHRTWLHALILIVNLIIVGYMLVVRVRSCRPPSECSQRRELPQKLHEPEKSGFFEADPSVLRFVPGKEVPPEGSRPGGHARP